MYLSKKKKPVYYTTRTHTTHQRLSTVSVRRCSGEERLPAVWLGQQCDLREAIGLLNDCSLGFKQRLWIEMHREPFKCIVKTVTFNIPRVLGDYVHQNIWLFWRFQRPYQHLMKSISVWYCFSTVPRQWTKGRNKEGMETLSVCAHVCVHQRHYFVTVKVKRFVFVTAIV